MKEYHIPFFLFLLFLFVRIIFIFNLPSFADESSYIRWGLLMIDNPAYRWASMTYLERQPLAIWIFGIGAKLLGNPLLGARCMTLLLSIPSFFAFLYICKKILKEKDVYAALILFSLTPILILLQSMALMDGIIMSVAVILFMMIVMLQKKQSIVLLAVIGVLLGILLWIKTTALLVVGLTGISLLVICLKQKKLIVASVLLSGIPMLVAGIMLIPLIVRPDINSLIGESGHFTLPARELIQFPFSLWAENGIILTIGLIIYLTPVACILFFSGIKRIKEDHRGILLLWVVLPLLFSLVAVKLFRLRYVACALPFTIPFVVAAVKSKIIRYLLYGSLVISSGMLIFSPRTFFAWFPTTIPRLKEREYAYGWTAGYGVRGVVQFIDKQLADNNKTLILAVPDSAGNPTELILATYFYNPHVKALIITTTNETDFRKIEPLTQKVPVYLITRQGLIPSDIQKYLKPMVTFQTSKEEEYTGLYQIIF